MDEQCSIGQFVNELCHKSCYGFISEELKHLNEFDDCVQELFNLRIRSAEDSIKYGYYRIEALERNLRARHLSSDERLRLEGELEEVKEELKRNQHELKHLQKENTKSFAMAAILMFLCFLVFGVYKMLQNK